MPPGKTPLGASVVIPTLERSAYLLQCLRDLLRQTHRPLQIVVVDQSTSMDNAVANLTTQRGVEITYLHVRCRNLPAARNLGWLKARHDAIVFLDDDTRCGPELVSEHVHALCRRGVGAVAGAIDEQEPSKERFPGTFNRWTARPYRRFDGTEERSVDHVPGGNFSTWRYVLRALGGFDEAMGLGAALYEEAEFSLRVRAAGHTIHFNPRARVTHLAAPHGGAREPDMRRYVHALGHNRSVLIRRHLRWYHAAVALPRLVALGAAYARHYRDPRLVTACLAGAREGWRTGAEPPRCTGIPEPA